MRATPGNRDFRAVYSSGGHNITAVLVAGTFDTGVRSDSDAPLLIMATISPNKNRLMTTLRILGDRPRLSPSSVPQSGRRILFEEFIGESTPDRTVTKILMRTFTTQIRATSVTNPDVSDAGQIEVRTL